MAELQVIYDPAREMAAIIDIDNRRALPIAAVGPTAAAFLEGFIEATPFDVRVLPPETIMDAYQSFLDGIMGAAEVAPDEGATVDVVEPVGEPMEHEAAAAVAEATNASDVPAPAPADTDEPAAENPPSHEVTCWNCNGAKVIEFGDGSEPQQCNMCNGRGVVTVTPA